MLRRWSGTEWQVVSDTSDEVQNNVDMQIAELEARLETSTQSILSSVSERYTTLTSTAELIQQLSTIATQTSSNYTWTVNQINDLKTNTTSSAGELAQQLQSIMTYMAFDANGLTIGKTGNPMKLKISNDKVSFLQNDNEIAYFSSNRLYVKSGEFLTNMKLGNFEFVPQTNGNLSFVKAVG